MKTFFIFTTLVALVFAYSANDFYHINDNNVECVLCNYIVSETQHYLNNNYTVTEIENKLDILCSHLPNVSEKCQTIVNTYLPEIVDLLENISPDIICDKLNFCSNSTLIY